MIQTINGIEYDTEKANALATWSNRANRQAPEFYTETLYKKENGEYFVYGTGGIDSFYGRMIDGVKVATEQLTPVSREQAETWAENRFIGWKVDEIFSI